MDDLASTQRVPAAMSNPFPLPETSNFAVAPISHTGDQDVGSAEFGLGTQDALSFEESARQRYPKLPRRAIERLPRMEGLNIEYRIWDFGCFAALARLKDVLPSWRSLCKTVLPLIIHGGHGSDGRRTGGSHRAAIDSR